jgi:hypothetical protein
MYIDTVNGDSPDTARQRRPFDCLTPIHPNRRLTLEGGEGNADPAMRLLDFIAPVGLGQRALIVAPPKAGKTVLLKKIAQAVRLNHPDIELIVLLIDERPEEVTDLRRSVDAQVVYSTFDAPQENHVRVADMVYERAQRLVEQGKHVVVLMDSLTRLARAAFFERRETVFGLFKFDIIEIYGIAHFKRYRRIARRSPERKRDRRVLNSLGRDERALVERPGLLHGNAVYVGFYRLGIFAPYIVVPDLDIQIGFFHFSAYFKREIVAAAFLYRKPEGFAVAAYPGRRGICDRLVRAVRIRAVDFKPPAIVPGILFAEEFYASSVTADQTRQIFLRRGEIAEREKIPLAGKRRERKQASQNQS